ncbi:MAG: hydrolase [Legionellaceae bacterium]|nr:hydrolase [Legionellaceae bacterium]
MIIESRFKPAWWLANPHAQTMYPTLARRLQASIDHVERFELPDGDFIDLAWAVNGLSPDAPVVVFLHGLGGNAHSTYVAGQLQAYNRMGWRAVLMHFRGASAEPNRFMRAYHSGDTADLNCFLHALAEREPNTKKAVVGVSLGGNVLLKWLGEQEQQSLIHAAVAVSVPFSLNSVADRINKGFSRIYQTYLLKRMRAMFLRKLANNAEPFPDFEQEINATSCFWTFDERITAPLHGYPHVHAYYRESSSRQYLSRIATPTLIIHALDDPFMTPDVVPLAHELSDNVTLELSRKGGHVGFISGHIPGNPIYWLDQRIPDYLQLILG